MSARVHPELGALFDLSARAKFRISGADRLRYLNGQISNDLRKATAQDAIHGCVLNAKGKINADVFVVAEGETFLIDCEAAAREQLPLRLERYIIADDVQVEDVTDEFALFHLLGPNAGDSALPGKSVRAARFGSAGTDLWIAREEHDAAVAQLAAELPLCDEARAETFRIERGLPRWGNELTDEIIPTEANLESDAIDYAKGCYIGQEVISRIKMSGQTNKRLCGLIAGPDAALSAGLRLWTRDAEAKEVGWITSATFSERVGAQIALGFVKRGFQTPGTSLHARPAGDQAVGASTVVELVALPFVR